MKAAIGLAIVSGMLGAGAVVVVKIGLISIAVLATLSVTVIATSVVIFFGMIVFILEIYSVFSKTPFPKVLMTFLGYVILFCLGPAILAVMATYSAFTLF